MKLESDSVTGLLMSPGDFSGHFSKNLLQNGTALSQNQGQKTHTQLISNGLGMSNKQHYQKILDLMNKKISSSLKDRDSFNSKHGFSTSKGAHISTSNYGNQIKSSSGSNGVTASNAPSKNKDNGSFKQPKQPDSLGKYHKVKPGDIFRKRISHRRNHELDPERMKRNKTKIMMEW